MNLALDEVSWEVRPESALPAAPPLSLPRPARCEGPQSALDPAGRGAERLVELFAALTAAAAVIWCVALALYATYARRKPGAHAAGSWLIVGGGVAVPIV